jgi:alpha-L-fucosidase
MKHFLGLIFIGIIVLGCNTFHPEGELQPSETYMQVYEKMLDRMAWWQEARFGLFIHFGAYSHLEQEEWYKSSREKTHQEYNELIKDFRPEKTDAGEWAKLARSAGMKYAVLTAKHHESFYMFDTQTTDYKITTHMPGRDIVREFVDAFREEGMKVGLYYSVIDWHHPDYPHYGDAFHPARNDTTYRDVEHDFDSYLDYMHQQVYELVTNYGEISIMWFDFSYDEMRDEKWRARELVEMVNKHQPGIIINNRLGLGEPEEWGLEELKLGMYITPEMRVPEKPYTDTNGNLLPWELCLTTNNNWSYHKDDHHWKSPELIIHTLVKCVANGGNLLFNLGPDRNGQVPHEHWNIYREVGKWLETHGESIYGCGPSEFERQEWGYFTQSGNKIYAHKMYPYIGHIKIPEFYDRVEEITVLTTKEPALYTNYWWGDHDDTDNNLFVNLKQLENQIHFTYDLPDSINTVYKITLKK